MRKLAPAYLSTEKDSWLGGEENSWFIYYWKLSAGNNHDRKTRVSFSSEKELWSASCLQLQVDSEEAQLVTSNAFNATSNRKAFAL